MTKKQLADVLIKILGLWFCVDGIIRVVTGMFTLLASLVSRYGGTSTYAWVSPFTGLVLGLIGFLLIVLSRPLADVLFREE